MGEANAYECPVERCAYAGDLEGVVNHVDGLATPSHSWGALGYTNSAEFERIARAERESKRTEDGKIPPSPLSELYEAFRGIRTALSAVISSEESSVEEGDLTEPIVQYHEVLKSFCGTTKHESGDILGYGPQHVDRVEHKMVRYREHYGNGDWITDYQCIEVEPLSQAARETLLSYDLIERPALLVRPVTPKAGIPVPESTLTTDELARALSILTRFPSEPPVRCDAETPPAGFPLKRAYESILSETDVEPVRYDRYRPHTGSATSVSSPRTDTVPNWRNSPAALTSPQSESEVEKFLTRYGKLTHLYREVTPPEETPIEEPVPVFSLDFYDPISRTDNPSQHSFRILSFAKRSEDRFRGYFVNRVRDFVHQRLLRDSPDYDYITVYPGHEARSLSPSLVALAKRATVETPIVYSELLERTETTERQSNMDKESRWDVAREPFETLSARHQLTNDRVVVLDDIATSGGSLCTAAHLLRRAGASKVIGLTLGLTRSQNTAVTREVNNREFTVSDIVSGER